MAGAVNSAQGSLSSGSVVSPPDWERVVRGTPLSRTCQAIIALSDGFYAPVKPGIDPLTGVAYVSYVANCGAVPISAGQQISIQARMFVTPSSGTAAELMAQFNN